MKALVYHGPGKKAWEEKPKPTITEPTDAIVKIVKTTICGTDLHIMKGDLPAVTDGRIIGHEGIGIIDEAGSGVANYKKGDHVLISCITSCGKCENCKKAMYSHCEKGGWILGNLIDGTQAEYVRIPYADNSLYPIPADADEEAMVMLSDVLPTGFECGVLSGKVKPGDTIAIVGAGPIGMAALLTSQFYSPAEIIVIDMDDNRLEVAKTFGATHTINSSTENALEKVMSLTNDKGVDVAIEAVGIAPTFELCESIVGAGGHIANIGVHGKSVTLHMESLWSKNITITTHLVDTATIPMLFKTVQSKKIEPKKLITHRFKLDQIIEAYEAFGNAEKEKTLKVILTNKEEFTNRKSYQNSK
jgi:alcohol dehydrogenase